MRALTFLFLTALLAPFASARVVDIACVLPANDVNGNPANVQGVRFYADGNQIADEPGCLASVDMPSGTYRFTWAAYNAVGEGAQSGPTVFQVVPEPAVPEQGAPPTVTFSVADAGPPDAEYLAMSPSADSIHPDASAGTPVRVWYVDGNNVEVNYRGSVRTSPAESTYSVAVSEQMPAGWTEPRQIVWN